MQDFFIFIAGAGAGASLFALAVFRVAVNQRQKTIKNSDSELPPIPPLFRTRYDDRAAEIWIRRSSGRN